MKNTILLIIGFCFLSLSAVAGGSYKTTKIKNANKNEHTLFVFSDPPLSDIYINGVKQEAPTPAVVRVPANAAPVIEIKKDGHQPFKKKIYTKGSGSKFSATLKKKKKK